MPEVIVIDEIGTELEALAARTIAERGVQLVGTAHGNSIENLIKNPTLCDLVGGIQSVTLGDEEARRRGSQKTVLERKALPTFEIAVEMLERQRWVVHENVADIVDGLLRGLPPNPQVRTVNEQGQVIITREAPSLAAAPRRSRSVSVGESPFPHQAHPVVRWEKRHQTGQILPFPNSPNLDKTLERVTEHEQPLATSLTQSNPEGTVPSLRLYPYGIGRQQLAQVIDMLSLPVVLSKNIEQADAILALRSHLRKHANLRRMADEYQLPIHTIKANTIPNITRTLRQVLGIEGMEALAENTPGFFSQTGDEDSEMDALEEARLAVEQVVIPLGQPVELLPRAAHVRKMQHELIEHYRLKSSSFGIEPNRRLRIYPA